MIANRRIKKLNSCLYRTVMVILNNGMEYTGTLVPRNPIGYCIIYEEDDSERVQFFYCSQLSELWLFEKGQMKKVFSVIKDD